MTSSSTFVNRSAQEHLLYIQEKVNPVLEALVTAVLLEKPEDPEFFMLKWLCEQTKSLEGPDQAQRSGAATTEEIETVKAEIEKLKGRRAELIAMLSPRQNKTADGKSDKSTKADEDEEEEEEDDDEPEELPPPPNMNRGQRQSVSAEAYGQWNKKGDFTAPVYEKTAEQKERIEKCLAGSFLFNALEREELNTLILAFKEKTIKEKERIIEQGDDGECMFLIESGSVDCLKKGDDAEKVVKTCTAGEVFGELALLYNCPRAASVEGRETTTLWELDRETFNSIVKDAAAKKRTTYTEFLKKVPLFSNIDSYEMMTIADALKVETFEEKDTLIIKQSDAGDRFYVTLEGECVAKQCFSPGGPEQPVMIHKVGDYFGELALIKRQGRAASVYTSAPNTKVLSMDRDTFKRLMGPIEDILRREAKRYDRPFEGGSSSGA